MSQDGYSTVLDAILFLVFVSVCAVIISPVIMGHAAEQTSSSRGLRETSADTLVALSSDRADYFEYRILGDIADRIVREGGINATNNILYSDVTKALLGRGNRHKTIMNIAAEDAACQFIVSAGGSSQRLNPITNEFDQAADTLIDESIRAQIDERYSYEFSLRWVPFAGAPVFGDVRTGSPHPPGAVSSQASVTMPYTTNITSAYLEKLNEPDLCQIDQCIDRQSASSDEGSIRQEIRPALEGCLRNTTREVVYEIWNNTLGTVVSKDGPPDPLCALKRFSNNETLNRQIVVSAGNYGEDVVEKLVQASNAESLDRLTDSIAIGVADGSMNEVQARKTIVSWLKSRYEPSKAVATISIWVDPHAR